MLRRADKNLHKEAGGFNWEIHIHKITMENFTQGSILRESKKIEGKGIIASLVVS